MLVVVLTSPAAASEPTELARSHDIQVSYSVLTFVSSLAV